MLGATKPAQGGVEFQELDVSSAVVLCPEIAKLLSEFSSRP